MNDRDATHLYLLEQQVWNVCAFAGFIALALATAGFFLFFCLVALGLSTNINSFGTLGTIGIVLGSLFISKVVVKRLWLIAKATFVSISKRFGPHVSILTDVDPDQVKEKRRRQNPMGLVLFGLLSALLTGFFRLTRWSCATARPTGGFTHATCLWFGDSLYGELVLFVVKIHYAGIGVSGTLFGIVALLELQAVWRDSFLQRWLHSTSIPSWWNPMADIRDSESDDE